MVNLGHPFAQKTAMCHNIFGGIEINDWENLWNVQKGETHDTSK